MKTVLLKVDHLSKSDGDGHPLRDVNREIEKGEAISVIGPSGTGKSTFVNRLNQLETPDGENMRKEQDFDEGGGDLRAQVRTQGAYIGSGERSESFCMSAKPSVLTVSKDGVVAANAAAGKKTVKVTVTAK